MNYTLWSKGSMLGRTTPFLPGARSGGMMEYFHPSDAWESIGAPLAMLADEMPAVSRELSQVAQSMALENIAEPERTRRLQEALLQHPGHQRLRELREAVHVLALELRDERGHVIRTSSLMIVRTPLGMSADDDTTRALAGFGFEMSDLLLFASPESTPAE